MRPHVRAVVGHVDGDVADEADALLMGILPKGLPLAVEAVLDEGMVVHQVSKLRCVPGHGLGLPVPDILRPIRPALALEPILQGTEQRPVLQIPGMVRHIVGHLAAIEAGECLFKDSAAAVVEQPEVHLSGIAAPVGADVLVSQKALLLQEVQVHQIRVPGEGGGALVGGIPIARRGQGQPRHRGTVSW